MTSKENVFHLSSLCPCVVVGSVCGVAVWLAMECVCIMCSSREEMMREALGEISTQGSPHWWACAYGPHPQQLIMAEQAGVGLLDLRVS